MLVNLHNIVVQIHFYTDYHFKVQTSRFKLRLKFFQNTSQSRERETIKNINYPEFRIAPNFEGSMVYGKRVMTNVNGALH